MIDCSHANSNKDYKRQEAVLEEVIRQRVEGNASLMASCSKATCGGESTIRAI
jgi:phospho-2-dehydro-3-deoxyheptonate aldolase